MKTNYPRSFVKTPFKDFLCWESETSLTTKFLRCITPFVVVMLFLLNTNSVSAQCTKPSCLPNTPAQGANGPDPCEAKLYCSNSGAVQTGLIACTNAADTDGCGVDATAASSAQSIYSTADASVKELFSGGECNTETYLQWIVFATPPTVKGTKIQGVGAVDSWWLFHAGSVSIDPMGMCGNADPTAPWYNAGCIYDYPTVEAALTDPARCNNFNSSDLVICSDANQYEPFLNEDADINFNVYNIYYIALFWDTPTNGSLNFKVKECELEDPCPALAVSCPADNNQPSCQTQNQINTAFDAWKDAFTYNGGNDPVVEEYLVNGLPININSLEAPDRCGGSVTVTYNVSDNCDPVQMDSCSSTFTVADVQDFTVPGNGGSTVECAPSGPPTPPTVMDACGVVITPTGPTTGGTYQGCEGTIIYTWNYAENCGVFNHDYTYTYTIDYTGGVTAPADGMATVECPSNATNPGAPSDVTDACGRSVSAQLVGSSSNPNPVTCEGSVVWTYRYTACDGSTDDWTFTYTIDYTGGVTAPADDTATVECPADAVRCLTPPNVLDACGRTVVPVYVGVTSSPDPVTCEGTVEYRWSYTDCTGEVVDYYTFTYTIEYIDFTMPNDVAIDVQCPEDTDVIPTPPVVTDNCGNTMTPTGPVVETTPDPIVCIGTVTYTWTYEDCEGNNHDWVYTYNVEDTIDPEIQAPDDYAICNVAFPVILYADWTDNCADGGQISAVPTNILTNGCFQTADYVFTATDDCDNTASETVVVTREFDQYGSCETAFGRLSANNPPSQCFITDPDYNFNRWGWTNYIAEEGTYTLELYAGAAHCDTSRGDYVGTVTVTYSGGLVDVEYNILPGFTMSEAHVNIGCDKYPTLNNGKPTVAPGQYNFNLGALDNVNNYTLEDVEVDGPFWIIAHAVTCEVVCRCSISSDEGGSQTSTLDQIDCNGGANITDNQSNEMILDFDVYPVPFNSEFYVKYNFEYDTDVVIEIYNVKGILVDKVINSNYVQGTNAESKIDLNGKISNELLFVKLSTDKGLGIKKIVAANYFGNK